MFFFLFVHSLWLLGCIILWGHGCAADAMPLLPARWCSFCRTQKDDRLSQPYLVLIQRPDKGLNPRPWDLKPATLTIKPKPGLTDIILNYFLPFYKIYFFCLHFTIFPATIDDLLKRKPFISDANVKHRQVEFAVFTSINK